MQFCNYRLEYRQTFDSLIQSSSPSFSPFSLSLTPNLRPFRPFVSFLLLTKEINNIECESNCIQWLLCSFAHRLHWRCHFRSFNYNIYKFKMKRPLLIYDCFVFFVCLFPSLPLVILPSAGCLLLPSSISHKLRTIRATKTFPTFNSISLLNAQCVCSL